MKKIFATMFVFAFSLCCLSLVGCNEEQKEGKAVVYGVTGFCPVRIEMTVDGDGKVGSVEIDEYLSVYDIGKLTYEDGKYVKCGVPVPEKDGYAQFVRVGEVVFTYHDDRYASENEDFGDYIEQNEAQYIHSLVTGDFDIQDGSGTDLGVPFDVYDRHKIKKTEWADKMKNGYHEGNEYPVGWKEDMYNLITHIKNHGFYSYTGEEKADEGDSFKVGGFDTLVSQRNFHDYMRIALKAYDKACENIKE